MVKGIIREILRTHGKGGASDGASNTIGSWKWVLVLLPFIILAIILILIVSLLANATGGTETVIIPTGEVTPVVTEAK
jgi:hypothetical protein